MNTASSTLFALRSLLQERFPEAVQRSASGEVPATSAGALTLTKGRVTEVIASPGGYGADLLLQKVFQEHPHSAALIDGGDGFDPCGMPGEVLERLLWVRCLKIQEAVRAGDLLLRDGNLSLIVLDVRFLPSHELLRLPSSIWYRLRMLAEKSGVAMLVMTPLRLIPCPVQRWVLPLSLGLKAMECDRVQLIRELTLRPYEDSLLSEYQRRFN